jgi:transcription elongation factor GreA-like protein
MAYNRDAFKNAIEEHIGYALLEYYKVKLATRIRQASAAADRIARILDLLERGLVVTILHDIRGFTDRRRAINEAVTEVKAEDEKFRRAAEKLISARGKPRRLRPSVSDKGCLEFWAFLDAAVEVAFQAAGPG